MRINRNRKIFIILFSVALLAIVIFFSGRYLIYAKIENILKDRLGNLRDQGLHIHYDHSQINLWKGKIELYQLQLRSEPDTGHRFSAIVPYLLIKGVNTISFIQHHTLEVQSISCHQATIMYALNSRLLAIDSVKNQNEPLKNIIVGRIDFPDLILIVKDSLAHDTIAHFSSTLKIKQLEIERRYDSLVVTNGEMNFFNTAMKFPKNFYQGFTKNIRVAISDKRFQIDSLKIEPSLSRKEFSKRYGKEVDYIRGTVPYFICKGVSWLSYPTLALDADKVALRFNVSIYRDKRYPLKRSHRTLLPVHFLQRLPWKLSADSITIENSYASYEEYPAEGDSSGSIYFSQMNASILFTHNDASHKKEIQMKARGKFMGAGIVSADFRFPYDTLKPYRARGSLRNLPLEKLNDILGAAAQLKVESGMLTHLKFNFLYNMYRADGNVELNYSDLKISSLRENKNNEQAVNHLKTLLLSFIIKKNLDDKVSPEKKVGTILYYRHNKRSVFNYWANSIMSGVLSATNLDKYPITAKNNDHKNKREKEK